MNSRVQIVLLCEDQQHGVFLRKFLKKANPNYPLVRVEMCPKTKGSAEQYVRNRFPIELAAHRRRSVTQVLMVMLDGDKRGIHGRMAELDDACKNAEMRPRNSKDQVLVFIPTWNIETWLAYLEGETVDETERDYPRLPRPRDCAPHVDTLVKMCRNNALRKPAPTSLAASCIEYRRWADPA